jgi:hypothetical protein
MALSENQRVLLDILDPSVVGMTIRIRTQHGALQATNYLCTHLPQVSRLTVARLVVDIPKTGAASIRSKPAAWQLWVDVCESTRCTAGWLRLIAQAVMASDAGSAMLPFERGAKKPVQAQPHTVEAKRAQAKTVVMH